MDWVGLGIYCLLLLAVVCVWAWVAWEEFNEQD